MRPRASWCVIVVAAFALAGCAGRPRMLAEASAPGASEVRWACHDSLLVVALGGWGVSLVSTLDGHESAAWRLPDVPPQPARGLALSAAGETLAVATADSVRVFTTRGLLPLLARPGNALALALSDDGTQLLWTDGSFGQWLETPSGAEHWHGLLAAGAGALQWAGSLSRFVVARGLNVVSTGEDDPPSFWLGPFAPTLPRKLAISEAGQTLAVAESTASISLWHLADKHLLRRLVLGGNAHCENLALSPDARFIATSLGSRARVLWARSGRPLADWAPHEGAEVTDLAFAADGLELATVGANGSVRTWELPSAAGRLEGRATFEKTGRHGHAKPGRKSDGD